MKNLNLKEVCYNVEDELRPLAQMRNQTMTFDIPKVFVRGDSLRLKQILINLVSNAIKYTQKEGLIEVTVELNKHDLRIDVTDNGRGIPQEQLDTVFEKFMQADSSTTRDVEGTGLGLAITRELVALHGGSVKVTSSLGKGTTFSVILPVATSTTVKEGSIVDVLLVEDNLVEREQLIKLIEAEGLTVKATASAEDALNFMRKSLAKLVLLDIELPGLSGWDVLRSLKSEPRTRHIPVVVTTRSQNLAGMELGAREFLPKPIDLKLLVDRVHEWMVGEDSTILVIEDNTDQREVIREALRRSGFEVRTANNGKMGLKQLKKHEFGLILLDLMMPVMDGFEFLGELNADAKNKALPVVVYTAMDLTEAERARLKGSFVKVLQKAQTDVKDLVATVRTVLNRPAPAKQKSEKAPVVTPPPVGLIEAEVSKSGS